MKIVITGISFCEYIIELANGLASKGHRILVVLPKPLIRSTVGDDLNGLLRTGVSVLSCEEQRPWKAAYYHQPIQAITDFAPDILHIHENGELLTLAIILRFFRCPLALTIHDVTPHPGADAQQKKRRGLIKRLLKHKANAIHLHGAKLFSRFKALNPDLVDRVAIIPHGALKLFTHWAVGSIERDPMTCLFFGRMEKYRGIDNLLKIGRILKNKLPGIKIIVAGKGTELSKYKEKMAALGIFDIYDEYLPDEAIHSYFRRASLMLLPYHEASQSGVVSMCLPFGLPTVATDVGAMPETITDGVHGKIVRAGDAAAFASAVYCTLADRVKLSQMSQACKDLSDSVSFDILAERFAALYRAAIAEKTPVRIKRGP